MRPDIVSVYTEPVQHARRAELFVPKGRKRDPDDLPSSEGMAAGRRRGWNRKESSYRKFSLIQRFVRSAAGRPWADVWSDVCLVANNGVADMNFRNAVLRQVEIIRWVDARGRMQGSRNGDQDYSLPDFAIRHGGSYVDRTGILRFVEKTSHKTPKNISDFTIPIIVDPFREIHNVNGTWFEVIYGLWTTAQPRPKEFSGVPARIEGRMSMSTWSRRRNPLIKVSEPLSKRSLSGAELRARGLRNSESCYPRN